MAPIIANIAFDKLNAEYYAGELLSGKIIARYDGPVPVTEVKIKLKGKGEVHWSQTTGSGDNKRTVHHYNHEKYIEQEIMLFQSFEAETFGAGEYCYPFSIILPTNLPATFKGGHGEVKYKCKATVKTSEKSFFVSVSCKESRPFIVHAFAPLPSHVFQIQTEHGTKNLPLFSDCCCCFSSGQITTTMTIDKGGYIPGESIQFNAEISNKSRSDLQSIQLSIKQLIVYMALGGHTKHSANEIARSSSPHGVPAGGDLVWPVKMTIPLATPPTNLGTCKIITVDYHLEIDIGENSGCCAPDVHFRIPFIIGSAPQSTMNQPTGFSPQASFLPGYTPTQANVLQPGYPSPQPGYPAPQPGYPAPQPGYPVPQPGYPAPQPGYPAPQPGYPAPQLGYPAPQPGYPAAQPNFQTEFAPTQPYQPGSAATQPLQSGYSTPQQPTQEFAPSCPPAITEQPTGFTPAFDPAADAPKI